MKTVKVTQLRWANLAIVLVTAIAIGVVASVMCGVGALMLASKFPAVPQPVIQAAIGLVDMLGLGAVFAPGAGLVAIVGAFAIRAVIRKCGKAYAIRW